MSNMPASPSFRSARSSSIRCRTCRSSAIWSPTRCRARNVSDVRDAPTMKPVAFDYERPTTLADAAVLLGQANGFSKVLAGGQSLGPMLNLRLAQPDLLVDITSIAELTAVNETQDRLEIGACMTH